MKYNVSFDICAGVVTLIALGGMLFSRDMERRSNRIFFVLIVMHFVSIVFDIWSSICNSDPIQYGVLLRNLTNYVFLSVHTSEAVVFSLFLIDQLGLKKQMKQWQTMMILLPEVLLVIVPLGLNPFFHGVFGYDENGFYTHGQCMILLYVAANIYMIFCIAVLARCRASLTSYQRNAAFALLVLAYVPMIVQSFFMPNQLIEMFFQAIGLYGYLQSVENIDELRNPVTHVWNRQALSRDFTKALLNEEKIFAVIVKISQIEALKISSENTTLYHYIRMSLSEWFLTNARQLGLKFYDCDRGIYVTLVYGREGEFDCQKFAGRAEERFRRPWGSKAQSVIFSTQISMFSFPDPSMNAYDFLYIVVQPYFSTNQNVVYAEQNELLRLFQTNGKSANNKNVPEDLQINMDTFLTRITTLSPAERRVFDLYVAGYEVNEIPDKAFISINTVKKHNKSIYRKLGVSSREEIRMYVDLFYQCGRGEELTGQTSAQL